METGAQVLSAGRLACTKGVHDALVTHSLKAEDIAFVEKVVCQKQLSLEQTTMFSLHAALNTYTGKFSLTFNDILDRAAQARNSEFISLLAQDADKYFPELYDNPRLAEEQRQAIRRLINREYLALYNALREGSFDLTPDLLDYIGCPNQSLEIAGVKQNGKRELTALYDRCYNNVCIAEINAEGRSTPLEAELMKADKPVEQVYLADRPDGKLVPRTYCFGLIELLDILSKPNPTNPRSGKPFASWSLAMLQRRYGKEIVMYQRYLEGQQLA
jgi:hypothetical protein